jgi:hypothetical protein
VDGKQLVVHREQANKALAAIPISQLPVRVEHIEDVSTVDEDMEPGQICGHLSAFLK